MDKDEIDFYLTIEKQVRTQIKIKSSKFIATALPVESKDQAMSELGTIRTEFYDASHNCYSYIIGPKGMEYRYSDDGEPNGSAGKPILFAIKKYEYSDILVVVTRFFGGTKLGVGGLARAYGEATEEVLKLAKSKEVHITETLKIFTSYEDLAAVKQLILQSAVSYDEYYHDAVEFIANIPLTKVDGFINKLTDISAGRAGFVKL